MVHCLLYSYFKDLDQLCQDNDISYWADGGSLLGAVRDKGIIKHDDDIDICMYQKDFDKLKNILKNNKTYHLYLLSTYPIYKFEHREIPNVFIDIFVVEDHDDNIQYKHEKNRQTWPSAYYLKSEVYPLQRVKFGDLQIYIPNHPTSYLERMYGDWETPVDYGRH